MVLFSFHSSFSPILLNPIAPTCSYSAIAISTHLLSHSWSCFNHGKTKLQKNGNWIDDSLNVALEAFYERMAINMAPWRRGIPLSSLRDNHMGKCVGPKITLAIEEEKEVKCTNKVQAWAMQYKKHDCLCGWLKLIELVLCLWQMLF